MIRRCAPKGTQMFLTSPLRTVAVACLTLLFFYPGPAAAQDAEALIEDLESIAATPVREGQAAGLAVAVVRGADTLLLAGYGLADLELDVPLPVDGVLEIGSVTKQLTAATILQLAEQGELALDDDLTEYLPGYPLRGNEVTLRHLLNHTSGIRSYTEMSEYRQIETRPLARDTLVRLIAGEPVEFEPGSAMSYSNSGYFLLGLVIEEVTGISYEKYLETMIFEPLGMHRSGYCSNTEVVEGRVEGYILGAGGTLRRAPYQDHTWPYAAGSICSTAGDLIAWSRALHRGDFLSPASYAEMTRPQTLTDGHTLRYGLGLFLDQDEAGRTMIHHGGGIYGFLSETRYYPDEDLHIVVLMNTLGSARPEALATALADQITGRAEPARRVRPYDGDSRELWGGYTGRGWGRAMTITVERDADQLVAIENEGADTIPLRYLEGETFVSGPDRVGVVTTYTFVREGDRVSELHVDPAGGHFVLRRDDDPLARLWSSRAPRTSIVELDGHDVRIRTAAPHPNRIPGQPLILLEAGFGSTVNSWGPFIRQVADIAPVLAYDRAGIGESEWDGVEPTFEHIADRLRRLLAHVGAEPPFVLVGHSFGGDLVRFFAHYHPDETAGLVLLDPVTSSPADFLAALEEIGAGRAEYLEIHGVALSDDMPPGVRAETRMTNVFFLDGEPLVLPQPTDLPVFVLFSGLDVPADAQKTHSFDVAAHVAALERRKIARLGGWIMQVPQGEMTIVPSSGHFVHLDEPDLALEAVRRVVYPPIPRVLLQAIDRRGIGAAVERYHELKAWYPPSRFNEDLLNRFGYRLLRSDRYDEAIAVFRLNIEEYPDALNPWDSLADAYRQARQLELAEATWERAIEMAEGRGDGRATVYGERLERVREEIAGRR